MRKEEVYHTAGRIPPPVAAARAAPGSSVTGLSRTGPSDTNSISALSLMHRISEEGPSSEADSVPGRSAGSLGPDPGAESERTKAKVDRRRRAVV